MVPTGKPFVRDETIPDRGTRLKNPINLTLPGERHQLKCELYGESRRFTLRIVRFSANHLLRQDLCFDARFAGSKTEAKRKDCACFRFSLKPKNPQGKPAGFSLLGRFDLFQEESFSVYPVVVGRARGNPKTFSCLFSGEAGEVPKFYQLGHFWSHGV